jgi:putative tricarboxylic transport membrane protein
VSEQKPASGATPEEDLVVVNDVEPIRIVMDKRIELLVSLAFAATGVVIIYLASGFRVGSFPDPVTARGLPYFTGTYLLIACLYLAVRRVMTWSLIPGNYTVSEGHEDEPDHPSSAIRAFTMMGLAVLWGALLTPVGFLIVTPPIIAVMLWLMDIRTASKLLGFSLIFTLVIWLAFSEVLGVVLPYGVLTTLARSWGLIY